MAQTSGSMGAGVVVEAPAEQSGSVVWTAGLVDALFIVAIALVALLLRTLELSDYPQGLHGDEAWNGLDARSILDGNASAVWPWTPAALGQPAGPMFLTVPFEWALGPSIVAVRLPQALLGVGTVILGFFAMRELFGRPAAYVWAFLAACSAWLLFYNRTGFTVSAMPFAETASLLAVAVALKKQSWPWYLGAGIVVGAGLYGYYSYPLFAVGLGIWVLVHFAIERPQPAMLHARNLAIMGLAALLVVMPARDHFDREGPGWLVDRKGFSVANSPEYAVADSSWAKVQVYGDNGERLVKSLLGRGELDRGDGTGPTPAIDEITMLVFALGLVASGVLAVRRRKAAYLLPFIMIPFVLIGPMYSLEGYQRRSLGIAVFVFMAASVFIALLYESARARGGRWLLAAAALAVVAGAYYAGSQTYRYFGEQRGDYMMYVTYGPELTVASTWLAKQPNETPIYFFSDRWSINYETSRYLLLEHPNKFDRSPGFAKEGEAGVPDLDPDSGAIILLAGSAIQNEERNVLAKYPDAVRLEGPPVRGRPSVVAYVLSAE